MRVSFPESLRAPARLLRAGAAGPVLLACAAAAVHADGFLNPAGVVRGGTAAFRVDIEPAAFPDSSVEWSAEPTNRVSFPSGPFGRTVVARGDALGDVELRVGIKGLSGARPVAKVRVVPASTVKADAWIVGDNGVWARTEQDVRKLFDDANDILSQVGVSLSLDSISTTNRSDWFDLKDPPGVLATANQIASVTNGTGGLVYYFVNDIPEYRGLRRGSSILVEKDGSGQTIAHEACHCFGLSDIYTWDDESPLTLSPAMPLRHDRLPMEWGSDSETDGFYPPGLTQSNLVERLLMLGREVTNTVSVDIPFGDVWGVWYHWTNRPSGGGYVKYWHETNAPVGFFEHADPTPFLK